jgi:hypothetical protein
MASTVTLSKALIGKEDIQFEDADTTPSTFSRSASGASTQSITKLAAAHLNIEDAGSLITATEVEGALQEIAADIDSLSVVASAGQGADIASSATIIIPSGHLLFDVTGTTDISAITVNTGGAAGRLVMLQFDSTLTVKESSTLRLEDDFATQIGDVLTILYDGTNWREVARTAKHGITLHKNNGTLRNNEELGDVYSTSDADINYSAGNPLNGFIGGQNDRSF